MWTVALSIVMVGIVGVFVRDGSIKCDTATTQFRVSVGIFVT